MKKFLAVVLSVMMMLTVMGTVAFAAEEASGTWGGIDWTLDADGTLTIAPTAGEPVNDPNAASRTYEVGEWREAVVYNSKGVAQVEGGEPYAAYKNQITKLVIKEGVTSIGSFTGWLPNVTGEVVIPSTVTYIGQDCFNKTPIDKLTFAKGGTEELCIAHGAFKGLNIEEVTLPDDRPVHLHIWTFLNCKNLKHVTLPATVTGMVGCNHVDYLGSMSTPANPSWVNFSQIVGGWNNNGTIANPALETITFGSEEVRDMFFSYGDNKVGADDKYGVAYVGLTYCTSVNAAAKIAQPGDTVVLTRDTDEEKVLPAGVKLDKNGFVAEYVKEAGPTIAKIGKAEFLSIAEAIEEVNDNETITLVEDAVLESVLTIDKDITINAGGKSLMFAPEVALFATTTTPVQIIIENDANVKITDAIIDFTGANQAYNIRINGASSLTLDETVTVTGSGFSGNAFALTNVDAKLVFNGTKVELSNHEFQDGAYFIKSEPDHGYPVVVMNGADININNGISLSDYFITAFSS